MDKENILEVNLPKWPGLIVKGKSVTKDQAKEILIRTDNFGFYCNDRKWEKTINRLIFGHFLGVNSLNEELKKEFNLNNRLEVYDFKEELYIKKYRRIQDLCYLNNHRIASSWIGGTYGWCSWDGKIECNNYNIGKWPDAIEVYNEWVIIAKEFPFLNLKCQLLNSEISEDCEKIPVIEFEIKKGKVRAYKPKKLLDQPREVDIISIFNNPYAERGCTEEVLRDALDFVSAEYVIANKIKKGEFWERIK